MSQPKYTYITTAIDYANGPPHLGHAFEKVGADAMARYRRLKGESVRFVIGMDEHGQKVQQSAEAAGVTPREWVDTIAATFQSAWTRLGISNDDFMRTTEPRHYRAVEAIIERMREAGDLYKGSYSGYYCVGCEAFKREDELILSPGDAGGSTWRCPIHPTREVAWTEEENWFFRLSAYQDRLLEHIAEHPEFIQPESRRNEILRLIEGGLDDISVSRARMEWGVPWPGDPGHAVYVWIDALTNYLSAIGFPDEVYRECWPATYHVVGKDITRFHCVYWPAMLMSAGLELPRTVWGHGFVTVGDRKLSKSEGVQVDLDAAIERHGADAFRYYLLRDVPWNGDGEFSTDRFDARYTAELANDLGNLVNRVLSMIERYRGGIIPEGERTSLDDDVDAALQRYRDAMDANLLHHGVAAALDLARAANGFIEKRAPWQQAKDEAQAPALDATLASLARATLALATFFEPFMPGKMTELAERLGYAAVAPLDELVEPDIAGRAIVRGDVLFPRES